MNQDSSLPSQKSPQEEPKQQNLPKIEEEKEAIPEEEIPDHFYDSDLASINEKDFMSDNEPPKDQIQQRKLLHKEKLLHIHKTIIRLGTNIDKPARFDRISLKFKAVPEADVLPFPIKKEQQASYVHPDYYNSFYLMDQPETVYNLGKQHEDIQRLVTSMKRGQAAVFELQHLEVSQKNNIKKRVKVQVFVIWVQTWTTVIDLDCDGKIMKEIITRGEGHSRIAKYDEVKFDFKLSHGDHTVMHHHDSEYVKLQVEFIDKMPAILWKLLHSMKTQEKVKAIISDQVIRQLEGDKYSQLISDNNQQNTNDWVVELQVQDFHSIDDVFLDGRLLKKTIIKGVSTAKPDSASLCYFALQIYGLNGELLHQDACWNSDWWQDLGKLDLLNCRKQHLDDHSVSLLLKNAIKRMKPAEIAQLDCRDNSLFTFGKQYEEFKKLTGVEQIPNRIKLGIRLYNFGQGKNCFNMEQEEKVIQARRKKAIGVKYLQQGDIPKALKKFEQIVSFFSAGQINQQAYDQKISALMNCTLCLMKQQLKYPEIIKLCNQILQSPKHGYDPDKMKIKGPGHAKIEGKLPDSPDSDDERQSVELIQNPKIIDKCLYRKALALTKTGEGGQALDCLAKIESKSEEVIALQKEAEKLKAEYEKKSAKIFKNMFG